MADVALQHQIDALTSATASMTARLDVQAAELTSLKTQTEQRVSEPDLPSDELRAMLATLGKQVEALAGLRAGVTEEQLDERFGETDRALAKLAQRIESLAKDVETAASHLGDKEQELAALHQQFTESSTRIESVVDDIKEALSALSDMGSAPLEDITALIERVTTDVSSLAGRIERIETLTRETTQTSGHGVDELVRRIDSIDQRVAIVATEVARAKTLWPVALRSLEARLDDAVVHTRPLDEPAEAAGSHAEAAGSPAESPDDTSDDLLASLRDSLHAMETVAAEMARASDTLSPADDDVDTQDTAVAAAGGTIVPLRPTEP